MKTIITFFILLAFPPFIKGQNFDPCCDSLRQEFQREIDSLPKFDLFMKERYYGWSVNTTRDKNYSIGVGYYLLSGGDLYRRFPSLSYDTNLNYHFDGYIYHNFSIKLSYLITPAINLSTYTDFKQTSFFIQPSIGIDAWILSINYNYNWQLVDNLNIGSSHSISLYYRFGIIKNVWNDPDLNKSQWDKRQLKKRKSF